MNKVVITICTLFLTIAVLLITIPFIQIPKTTTETYQIPKSTFIVHNLIGLGFVFPSKIAGRGTELNANDTINIQANATAGKNIDFQVNAVNQSSNEIIATYLFYPNMTRVNTDWVVPLSSNYDFVFKSNNYFTLEDIALQVTKHWTETAYKDVTTHYQLLPFEFAYSGIALIIVGLGIFVYFKKPRK